MLVPCTYANHTGFLDKTTITLSFDQYLVQSGPSIPASDRRKFCQLQLKLKYPAGFQFSVFGVDWRGYASLESGVTGTAQTTYYFSGQQSQVRSQPHFPITPPHSVRST